MKKWLDPTGQGVALIKPQFEAGRRKSARGEGVIRDPAVHRQVLLDVLTFVQNEGFVVRGLIRSPLTGPKGNAEFLAWLALAEKHVPDLGDLVGSILSRAVENK